MVSLQSGQFYGDTSKEINLDGLIVTDTNYTMDFVDWHYHENAYFTFLIQGKVKEVNEKEKFNCVPGTLLFHNCYESHYNIKPKGFTRGFHLEIEKQWIESWGAKFEMRDSILTTDPALKILFCKLFKEFHFDVKPDRTAIEVLALEIVERTQNRKSGFIKKKPEWVDAINRILHEEPDRVTSLSSLAENLGVHPVHISRDFSKHFRCSMGDYRRRIKVERSVSMLSDRRKSLTDITFECGFSDQSHFVRCFKQYIGITPSSYRKFLRF